MEDTRPSLPTVLLTLVAPVAWATTYAVTKLWLPPDRPFFSAAMRVLPIGLVILLWRRTLPSGTWWWRTAVLGLTNIGLFMALLFVGAYRLPGGLASTLQSTSPLLVIALAALLIGERPTRAAVIGALIGISGVTLLVLRAGFAVDVVGVAAAIGSTAVSALGFVLVKRWQPPVDMLTLVGWQLVAGGLFLVPLALLVEGPPPPLSGTNLTAYAYLGIIGTGLAYVCWFRGLRRMPAAAASLLGLVNPVIATVLGIVVTHEAFGPTQALGMTLVFLGILLGQPAVVGWFRGRSALARDA